MGELMEETHKLELDDFAIEALMDSDGDTEVVFSRSGKPVFRALAKDLNIALTFVERHAEVRLVER